jgi:hypothetical protein
MLSVTLKNHSVLCDGKSESVLHRDKQRGREKNSMLLSASSQPSELFSGGVVILASDPVGKHGAEDICKI